MIAWQNANGGGKPMTSAEQALTVIVKRIIDDRSNFTHLHPVCIANEALLAIDPNRTLTSQAYIDCHLILRKLASQILREQRRKRGNKLQSRYRGASSGASILLDSMTHSDTTHNIDRLYSEAQAKLLHADSLRLQLQEPVYRKREDLIKEDHEYIKRLTSEIASEQKHLDAFIEWHEQRCVEEQSIQNSA